MRIRSDLLSVEQWLLRLTEYAHVFAQNNLENWSHLKNKEDFSLVYRLPPDQRVPLENIYADGRDLAVFMSGRLTAFNSVSDFPTLKSFVDSFNSGWLYQIDQLHAEVQAAEQVAEQLPECPWAVERMIVLYKQQIDLLAHVARCIDALRQSEIYALESDQSQLSPKILEYDVILRCIHGVGKMFERLPSTYVGKDEEALRDHMLVSLDGAVGGSATGETFNKRGKTDILVRSDGNNNFVGECKFWTGAEGFLDAVTQLLSYLSWRDTKCAVILFVPNKNFGAVIAKVELHAPSHPHFVRMVSKSDETWLNFEFKLPADQNRRIAMAVMLYHLSL